MQNKKVLVIGASGFIGDMVYKEFLNDSLYKTTGTYFSSFKPGLKFLDFKENAQVSLLLHDFSPDIVVLLSALTDVDECEKHNQKAYYYNVECVQHVAGLCEVIGAKLVYMSTDYIFDGKEGPYSENSHPSPVNYYGFTKSQAEDVVKRLESHLIIRTTAVYGRDRKFRSFLSRLIHNLLNGKEVHAAVDNVITPTFVQDIAVCLKSLTDARKTGIYHVAGDEVLSCYDFALKVVRSLNCDEEFLKPVLSSSLLQKAERPLRGGLLSDKVKQELKIQFSEANRILPFIYSTVNNEYVLRQENNA